MLSFIIVSYKSEDLLKKCINSIKNIADYLEYEIVIINNDTSLLDSFGNDNNLIIIENGKNIGFGAGCNLAAKKAKGDYYCFLNPDTELLSGSIKSLLSTFKTNPSVGVLSPLIISQDGLIEKWSFGKDPNLLNILKQNIFPFKPSISNNDHLTNVDWISGASFFIRKSIFNKINGFDERFFMYFEDVDLCKRVRQLKFKVMIFSSLKIKHIGGSSFSCKKSQKKYYYNSQDLYFQKHFGYLSLITVKFLRLFHK